jgi:hypothetical protein
VDAHPGLDAGFLIGAEDVLVLTEQKKPQPWEKPADGARRPLPTIRSITSAGTGRFVS